MNILQRLLSRGSQTAPEIIEEAGPLLKRGSTEAVEVGPEVIGKGVKATREAAEDIPDAVFRNLDEEAVKRMDPKLAKIAATLGLIGGGGALMMGGDDEQAQAPQPIAPKQPLAMPDELNQAAQSEALNQAIIEPGIARTPGIAPEAQAAPEAEGPDFVQMLKEAQANSAADRNMANLLRSSEMLAAGLARIRPEHGSSDIRRSQADKPVEDVKSQIATFKEQQSFDKLKKDLDDETKMRDPNSEISKLVSDLAIKTKLIKPGQSVSAMSLKNAGVNLGTLLATIEAGEARKAAAQLAREGRISEREDRTAAKREEEKLKREDKRKLVTEEIEERKRTIKDNIARAKQLVKETGTFELFGPQAELLSSIMDEVAVDMAKLQDPESVARPQEVALVRKNLIPEGVTGQLGMSNATASKILDAFENRVDERAATGYKVRGIDQPVAGQKKDNNSGEMVKVLPPGSTTPKLIPANQVDAALAAGGKLVK
jgi:hypothetical protein